MQVESSATHLLTIDVVEKVQRQKIASFIMYSNWLMRLWLTNSFHKKSCITAMDWKLFISILSDYYKTVFFFSISRKWKTVKVLSFSRTVSQFLMRVHKPKVEYKLVHLYRKNPREHLDVLVYKQF